MATIRDLLNASEPTPKKTEKLSKPKEFPATKLVGYTPIAKTCKGCHYITHDQTQCANKKVSQDKQITTGSNGLKDISPAGWCNEWEAR